MAFEIPLFDVAFTANTDMTALQYHFVEHGTADLTVGTANAATDTILGVLQNKPGSLQAAQVRIFGISKVVANGAISPGSLISSSASAKAVMVASGTATLYSIGISLDTVANANEVCSVLMLHNGRAA